MLRGLDGAKIFLDADDYHDFVDRLTRLLPECDARCLAWALMPNHAHLVIQTARGEISRVMRRLNTGYAIRFNRIYSRRGYVFQDRFRSRIVTGDADLMGLIRYVHRNPIEARFVDSLAALGRFPWCGHGALVGARRALAFEAIAEALALFDSADPAHSRERLLEWMAMDSPADEPHAAAEHPPAPPMNPMAARAFEAPGWVGLAALLGAAGERYGLTLDELCSGSRQRCIARARAVVAWVAVVELGIPAFRIAQSLGIRPSAVSHALSRGRRFAMSDEFRADAISLPVRNDSNSCRS